MAWSHLDAGEVKDYIVGIWQKIIFFFWVMLKLFFDETGNFIYLFNLAYGIHRDHAITDVQH